jgi:putative transferase (TIGR04331 family)
LFISTYNATTYLESLLWNIPTIIFWDGKYWEVTKEAESYFNLLRDVGIFHDTPESAANKMAEIWDDVDKWWQDEELQKVRIEFCDYFSRIPDNPLQVLQATLDKASS